MTHFAFLDEYAKKEIRRAILRAVAIPGYQVPFASRELPIARGWGTGGLQVTLALVGEKDVVKVIDQGSDESVNAVNIKKLITSTTGIPETTKTSEATLIQSRHRIPEEPLTANQILVLQVPIPEPLRWIEPKEEETKKMHADKEYSGAWLVLFDQLMKHGKMTTNADHSVLVEDRYVMAPSPIPRFDNEKLHHNEALLLFGAGREKKIYAIPPFTSIQSLGFEDYPLMVESFEGKSCQWCGRTTTFLDEWIDEETNQKVYTCNDTSDCLQTRNEKEKVH